MEQVAGQRGLPRAAALLLVLFLSGCERPPVETAQNGYRGTGIVQVYNPRTQGAQAALHTAPEMAPAARLRPDAPKAGAVYKNIQVLGNLSIAEFGRTMDAITGWVSPQQSCAYCHVEGDFADDSKYTKVVARRMIQMVRHVNSDWQSHVAQTGVTCYTCHRGQPLPAQTWFKPEVAASGSGFIGNRDGQNEPTPAGSLPVDAFTPFLRSEATASAIRVGGTTALPTGNTHSIQQTEHTYALMIHMSNALGVNCTYCHNSRAFASWSESSPQRATAWYGIRLARDLNSNYLDPLSKVFPEIPLGRLGPAKDAAKVNCATCHRGAFKPLNGAAMAVHYPALFAASAMPEAASAAASATLPAVAAAAALPAPIKPGD